MTLHFEEYKQQLQINHSSDFQKLNKKTAIQLRKVKSSKD